MSRSPFLGLALFTLGCGGPPVGAVQQDGQDVVVFCQRTAQLEVRLRCRRQASAAERDWLQLEFDNRTDGPLAVSQVRWNIAWAEIQDQAGQHLGTSSGLAQGSLDDLAPGLAPGKPWRLPPGLTRVAAPVSDQATASLGVVAAPMRVTPHAIVTAVVGDEPPQAEVGREPTFTFLWLPPDAEGLRRMRATLAELVRTEHQTLGTEYLLRRLLDLPAVGGTWSLDDLLALFAPSTDGATHWVWSAVLPVLDARFADSPTLAEWLLKRLRSDDVTIVADLQLLPHVWRPDFLPELLRRYETPVLDPRVPMLLEQRGAPHRGDAAACRALAEPWAKALAALDPTDVHRPRNDGEQHRPWFAAECARQLGLSRDRDRLAVLAPWLAVSALMYDGPIHRIAVTPPQTERVCDAVCDAVLRLLGEDPAAAWEQQLVAFPDPATRETEVIRDRQVAALQQRLRELGITTAPR